MKTIQLNKGTLQLPDCWEDLSPKQMVFAFRLLIKLYAGELVPFQFQLALLIEFTGYKTSRKTFFDFKSDEKETINFNLIQLAEQITFAFTLEGNKIIPNNDFKQNPLEYLVPDAPYFNRNITVDTNITAKQFADCLDLLMGYNSATDIAIKEHCLYKMFSVLYNYPMLWACGHSIEIPFGILCWFTGIASFFQHHPVYGVLFNRAGKEDELETDKINLGMNEVILYLKKEGYTDASDMTVIEFFNAQVKALKDSVSSALGSGMKEDELAHKTGLSISTINRLS